MLFRRMRLRLSPVRANLNVRTAGVFTTAVALDIARTFASDAIVTFVLMPIRAANARHRSQVLQRRMAP